MSIFTVLQQGVALYRFIRVGMILSVQIKRFKLNSYTCCQKIITPPRVLRQLHMQNARGCIAPVVGVCVRHQSTITRCGNGCSNQFIVTVLDGWPSRTVHQCLYQTHVLQWSECIWLIQTVPKAKVNTLHWAITLQLCMLITEGLSARFQMMGSAVGDIQLSIMCRNVQVIRT